MPEARLRSIISFRNCEVVQTNLDVVRTESHLVPSETVAAVEPNDASGDHNLSHKFAATVHLDMQRGLSLLVLDDSGEKRLALAVTPDLSL